MYGLVNNGIETFVTENFGANIWADVCKSANTPTTAFDQAQVYDDALTFDLVAAISDHLGKSQDEVLEVFGSYWVGFARATPIGALMSFAGSSFLEVLDSLDDMHQRMMAAMPHLKPPSFELEHIEGNHYRLHYYSVREGLAPMVVGLIHQLAATHGEEISLSQSRSRTDGADHDTFDMVIKGKNPGVSA